MSLHDLTAHFLYLQSNIPLYECTAVCLSIFKNIKGHLSCQFFVIMSKHIYRFLCGHEFSDQLSKYLGKWFAGSYGKTQFNFVISS